MFSATTNVHYYKHCPPLFQILDPPLTGHSDVGTWDSNLGGVGASQVAEGPAVMIVIVTGNIMGHFSHFTIIHTGYGRFSLSLIIFAPQILRKNNSAQS